MTDNDLNQVYKVRTNIDRQKTYLQLSRMKILFKIDNYKLNDDENLYFISKNFTM
jgi:hypothetical protein